MRQFVKFVKFALKNFGNDIDVGPSVVLRCCCKTQMLELLTALRAGNYTN